MGHYNLFRSHFKSLGDEKMKRMSLYCLCILFLCSCSQFNEPLLNGEMVKLTIECKEGEIIEIENEKTINKVVREINESKREGTQEMEFDLEHLSTLENNEGETKSFNLFSNGKVTMAGYYIHSNIDNFCEE